jgi:DNA-binding response OmpR family regulator
MDASNLTQQFNGKRVLCIEDEHFISELYTRSLTKAGYEVTVVVDGNEALEEAKTDKYDIILLDIMVPNMIGTDILKALHDKSGEKTIKAKIIITTNLEQDDAGRAAIESLADGYIVKAEATPRQLVEFLQELKF